jgi:hypothetical protein
MTYKTKLKSEIFNEMGISGGTLKKLLYDTLDENFKLYASALGKIQDFVWKYAYYETMRPEDLKFINYKEIQAEMIADLNKKAEKIKPLTIKASKLPDTFKTTLSEIEDEQTSEDFYSKLRDLIEATPSGVSMSITITKK